MLRRTHAGWCALNGWAEWRRQMNPSHLLRLGRFALIRWRDAASEAALGMRTSGEASIWTFPHVEVRWGNLPARCAS